MDRSRADEDDKHECMACGAPVTTGVALEGYDWMAPCCHGLTRCWHVAWHRLATELGEECPVPVETV